MNSSVSIWPALTAFATVIALIPVVLWLLKRLQSHRLGAPGAITVSGGLSLGARERLVIVESAGRRWMIGVTPQTISLIAELTGSPTASTADPATLAVTTPGGDSTARLASRPFGDWLDRMKRHD